MRKTVSRFLFCVFGFLAGCSNEQATTPIEHNQLHAETSAASLIAGQTLYETHCASCHGADLRGGGLGSALVKTVWDFGRDEFSITNNISNGIPSMGMPAFNTLLTEDETLDIYNYIKAAQTDDLAAPNPIPSNIETEQYRLNVERTSSELLDAPWGIEFVDDNRALVTDNDGDIFWLVDGVIDPTPIQGVPEVDRATSTGGLLDVEIDPAFSENQRIFLAYSHSEDPEDRYAPGLTRVISARLDEYELSDIKFLFKADEKFHTGDIKHWGGRMLIGEDGDLFFTVGDMSVPEASQELSAPTGKIYRVDLDGNPLNGNPFFGDGEIASAVYSYGNRNAQGIAQHPETGEIWSSEHGPHGGDELNIIKSGANYGWPIVTHGVNYDGSVISELTEKEGVEAPVKVWTPAIAVSAIEFVHGDEFKKWENNLLVGSLSREELYRLTIEGDEIVAEESLFKGYGRVRDIKTGPDGALYVLLNSPGEIVRLTTAQDDAAVIHRADACASNPPEPSKLEAAKRYMDEANAPIHSLVVLHCGRRIFEDYRLGYDSIMPHDLQSATKTYTMLLIGALIEDGRIASVDSTLKELLPDYAHLLEGEKATITLHHVLSMTTGLEWRDFGKGNSFEKIITAKDSVEFILAQPLISTPGETFFYNTGSSHLLSAIVTEVTGKSAFEFADETLFTPLAMMDYEWDAFPDGLSLGGWGIYKRPRDMAKIGQLILNNGVWDGRQIVNAEFLEAATVKQIDTGEGVGGGGYGYQMWIPDGFSKTDVAAALGFGGQSIYVFDDLDLVVVFTASVETPNLSAEAENHVLSQFIVPEYADTAAAP